MTSSKKEVFSDVGDIEPELIAHGVEAELSDCRTTLVITDGLGSVELDVNQARVVCDWLRKVIPQDADDDVWATCDHMTCVPRGLQDREGCDD